MNNTQETHENELFDNYYVDIPKEGSDEWMNIATFHTRQEAIAFAKETFGADDNGMICLISPFEPPEI